MIITSTLILCIFQFSCHRPSHRTEIILEVYSEHPGEAPDLDVFTEKMMARLEAYGISESDIYFEKDGDSFLNITIRNDGEEEQLRKLIRSQGILEFRETVAFFESRPVVLSVNEKVKSLMYPDSVLKKRALTASETDSLQIDSTYLEKSMSEGTFEDVFNALSGGNEVDREYSGLRDDKLQKRVREIDPFLGLFDVNHPYDPGSPLAGLVRPEDTALVNLWLNHPEVKKIMPTNIKFLWEIKPLKYPIGTTNDSLDLLGLIAIRTNLDDVAPLYGDVVTDARQDFDNNSYQPTITMEMNEEGAKKWAHLTEMNIGQSIAIVLDDYVYSYPTVQNRINGGSSMISGNFTIDEARDLAAVIRGGALPYRFNIVKFETYPLVQ